MLLNSAISSILVFWRLNRLRKRIGIIGANGQLGSEVCLLLSQMEDVEVVPICRNHVGASFLRRCGLTVRTGTTDNETNSRRLLEGLDLVADFSLPAGSSSHVRSQITQTISNINRFAPPRAPFVYLSSILAFGNPDFRSELRNYWFSRSAYGSTKRYAERLAQKLSEKHHRPAYVFRVGVVHGDLQAATRQAVKDLKASAHLTAYLPDCESYTVFAFSIAEALVSAVHQKDSPGLYTLVSNPAWSWKELHQYLCEKAGIDQPSVLVQAQQIRSDGWLRRVRRSVFGALRHHKEFLNGYVGAVSPKVEQQMRATYHARNASAEIARGVMESRYMPYLCNFSRYPGRRLSGISDSRVTMFEPSRRLLEGMELIAQRGPLRSSETFRLGYSARASAS
jgi:nucleoside-diphosphate-sugar epimerase